MANIIKVRSEVDPVQELPNGDRINLELVSEYVELSEEQQLFITEYFNLYPQRTQTLLLTGISHRKYSQWNKGDKNFQSMMQVVEDIHNENLTRIEYMKAYTDDNVRGRFLKANKARGYDNKKPSTTNILNVGKNMNPSELKEFLS